MEGVLALARGEASSEEGYAVMVSSHADYLNTERLSACVEVTRVSSVFVHP